MAGSSTPASTATTNASPARPCCTPSLPWPLHLRSSTGRTRLVFQPNGGNAGSHVTFTLCDGRGIEKATTLVLANDGRLRQGKPTEAAAQACVDGG